MTTKQTFLWLPLCLLLASWCVSPAVGEVIHYNASVTPNDPSIAGTFSYIKSSNAIWSTDGSVLTMTPTDNSSDVWFGWSDFPRQGGTPNWAFAPSSIGNEITVTCRVSPGSEYFALGFGDGTYLSGMNIGDGSVRITSPSGEFMNVSLDTTDFHTYSILSVNGQTTYTIDGTTYAGGSTPLDSRSLYIGDFNCYPHGSMYVDDVKIFTGVPEPSTFALFSVLALIGGAFAWRKRKCRDV